MTTRTAPVADLIAQDVPFSSTVGKALLLCEPSGAAVAQLAIMVSNVAYPYRETAEAVADRIKAALGAAPVLICAGCGSDMTDAELAAERATRPELRSCCPERKMRPITREDYAGLRGELQGVEMIEEARQAIERGARVTDHSFKL